MYTQTWHERYLHNRKKIGQVISKTEHREGVWANVLLSRCFEMIDPAARIHPMALVERGALIGPNTRICAFTHILPGASIGESCNICDHVFVENNVSIGDRVTIKCGVQLWDGIQVESDVFIGPNATFCNDMYPRSKHYPEKYLPTLLKRGSSIGAGATILPGLVIGESAMIGAGSVVIHDVPPKAVVVGNPARIIKLLD